MHLKPLPVSSPSYLSLSTVAAALATPIAGAQMRCLFILCFSLLCFPSIYVIFPVPPFSQFKIIYFVSFSKIIYSVNFLGKMSPKKAFALHHEACNLPSLPCSFSFQPLTLPMYHCFPSPLCSILELAMS